MTAALAHDVRTPCEQAPDLFHAYDQETRPERDAREAEAKAICFGCPDKVRESCLAIAMTAEHGLTAQHRNGLYGGLNEHERAALDNGPKRLGPEPSPCGTLAAYKRHQRKGEQPCGPCKEAKRLDHHDRKVRVA